MPDPRDIHELEAKIAMLESELRIERAQATATLAAKEQMLEAERRMREDFEQSSANVQRALEEAYQARLQALEAEVELWRRDDVPGLLWWFERRLATIDSTLAQLDGSPDPSEAMRVRVDGLRTERIEIESIRVRLQTR